VCAAHCPLVRSLDLYQCHSAVNRGKHTLASGLANKLRSVDLQDCAQRKDRVVLVIAEHCPLLVEITCTIRTTHPWSSRQRTALRCAELGEAATCPSRRRWRHCSGHALLQARNSVSVRLPRRHHSECNQSLRAFEAIARDCSALRCLQGRRGTIPAAAGLPLAECCSLLKEVDLCCGEVGEAVVTALVHDTTLVVAYCRQLCAVLGASAAVNITVLC
jgi:hypothetical protein